MNCVMQIKNIFVKESRKHTGLIYQDYSQLYYTFKEQGQLFITSLFTLIILGKIVNLFWVYR